MGCAYIKQVCDQLSVDETAMELALTRQINVIRGEETERKLRLEQAEDVRDAAAKVWGFLQGPGLSVVAGALLPMLSTRSISGLLGT